MKYGFIDVSNMTARQVQQLGHQDDVAPYRATSKPKKVALNFNADDVWDFQESSLGQRADVLDDN